MSHVPAPPALTARQRDGILAHRLIARLVTDGLPHVVTHDWVLAQTAAILKEAGVRRAPVLQRLASLAAIYVGRFAPSPDWRLVGTELDIEGGRLDILWETPSGRVVDEIKTGVTALVDDGGDALRQARGYARTLAASLGSGFLGIRLLTLASPASAVLVLPDESVRPLGTTGKGDRS